MRIDSRWLVLLAAVGSLAAAGDRAGNLDARRERLLAMSAERFEQVEHNRDRLAQLSASEQTKLRRLESELDRAADGDRLRRVMLRYHEWLRQLNSPLRGEILDLPPDKRAAKIKQVRAEQHEHIRAEAAAGAPLTPADMGAILDFVENHALKHQDKLLAELPAARRRQIEQMDLGKRRRALLWVIFQRAHNGKAIAATLPPYTLAEINALADKLSPEAKKRFQEAGALAKQKHLLRQWTQAAARHRLEETGLTRPLSPIAAEDLRHFFETGLTPGERGELLSMTPEKMRRELRRKYFLRPGHADAGASPAERPADANDPPPSSEGDEKPSKGRRANERLRNRLKNPLETNQGPAAAKDAADSGVKEAADSGVKN